MENKNDKFIEFPENYTKILWDLIQHCYSQIEINKKRQKEYEDGLNACEKRIKYVFELVREDNGLTYKYSQLYLKYENFCKLKKTAKKNTAGAANQTFDGLKQQKQAYENRLRQFAKKIKSQNYTIIQSYNEMRKSLDSIKENLEAYIARTKAYDKTSVTLNEYSCQINIISPLIKGYNTLQNKQIKNNLNKCDKSNLNEQKEKILEKCQEIENCEKKIKLQLMGLIAIGDEELKKKLQSKTLYRLTSEIKKPYNIIKLIEDTRSRVDYTKIENNMRELKTISDNLSKINKQWDSKK